MDFYEIIKKLRLEKRLSQDQLAHMTGYTDRSSIAKIESGKVKLNPDKLRLFEQALGCKPGELRMCSDEYREVCAAFDEADADDILEVYSQLTWDGKQKVIDYAKYILALEQQENKNT